MNKKITKKERILLWGSKSKAIIIQKMLNDQNREISFIYYKTSESVNFQTKAKFSNLKSDLFDFIKKSTHFIVCIGTENKARYLISKKLIDYDLKPSSIISEHSIIDNTVKIGWGAQCMPGATLNCFSQIGNSVILNTNPTVDHECYIGNGVHIMGSVAIAGRVKISDYATIGTNATILPDITIGKGAYIGAGALVNKDVQDYEVVIGNPAKYLRNNKLNYDLSDFLKK